MQDKFLKSEVKQTIWRTVMSTKGKQEKALEDLGKTEEDYKKEVLTIRKRSFFDFENKLKQAKKNLEENGFVVHDAVDAGRAREIMSKLLRDSQKIAKAKSNTIKEVNSEGISAEIYETDLGDAIVQMFKEEDLHYVLPAIRFSSADIAAKIQEVYGEEIEADPEKLTHYLTGKIRQKILQADTGLTGANFFTQTGQVVLLENEGNISLVTRLPQKHVVVCGIDKLVESTADAMKLCQTAAIFGTGQKSTKYVSVISGPSATADIENKLVNGAQGAKEVHIILLDNGRREMLEKDFDDLLCCINCGACINFCPVYHQIGEKYGGKKYIGSKGIVYSAFQRTGQEALETFSDKIKNTGDSVDNRFLYQAKKKGSFQCTLCGSCKNNCPMSIGLPDMVRKVRTQQHKGGVQTKANREMLEKVKETGNPFGIKDGSKEIPDKLYCC